MIIQYCPIKVLLFFAIVSLKSHMYFFLLKDSHENRNKVINIVKINWATTKHKFLKQGLKAPKQSRQPKYSLRIQSNF